MHVRRGQSLLAPKPSTGGELVDISFKNLAIAMASVVAIVLFSILVVVFQEAWVNGAGWHSGHLGLESGGRSVRSRRRDLRHVDHIAAGLDDRGAAGGRYRHFYH